MGIAGIVDTVSCKRVCVVVNGCRKAAIISHYDFVSGMGMISCGQSHGGGW